MIGHQILCSDWLNLELLRCDWLNLELLPSDWLNLDRQVAPPLKVPRLHLREMAFEFQPRDVTDVFLLSSAISLTNLREMKAHACYTVARCMPGGRL